MEIVKKEVKLKLKIRIRTKTNLEIKKADDVLWGEKVNSDNLTRLPKD